MKSTHDVVGTSTPLSMPSERSPITDRRGEIAPSSRSTRIVGWLALMVVFAGVFEMTCRVEDWIMYRMPIGSRYRSVEDLLIRDADGIHGRPNAQFEKWIMNGIGTRGPAASAVPKVGTIRVVTVGASETFGLRESIGHEYPRQLEESLSVRRLDARCPVGDGTANATFEVLNAAFAGMTVPTIEQDVRNRLRRFHPTVIVAYPSAVAYLENERPVAARPDSTPVPPLSGMRALHPRSRERAREQVKQMVPEFIKAWLRQRETDAVVRAHPPGWQFSSVPLDRAAAFESDLRRLIGTIRSVGAVPVLVTHANIFIGRRTRDRQMLVAWQKFFPRATGESLIAFDSVARLATIKIGADSSVVVVDAAPLLAAAPITAFADYVHFTDLGAAQMARVVADGVIASVRERPCDLPCCILSRSAGNSTSDR